MTFSPEARFAHSPDELQGYNSFQSGLLFGTSVPVNRGQRLPEKSQVLTPLPLSQYPDRLDLSRGLLRDRRLDRHTTYMLVFHLERTCACACYGPT